MVYCNTLLGQYTSNVWGTPTGWLDQLAVKPSVSAFLGKISTMHFGDDGFEVHTQLNGHSVAEIDDVSQGVQRLNDIFVVDGTVEFIGLFPDPIEARKPATARWHLEFLWRKNAELPMKGIHHVLD